MIQVLSGRLPAVFAHAGHGHTDPNSLLHALAEPEHAALIVVPLVLGGIAVWARRSRTSRKEARPGAPSLRRGGR